MNLFKITKTYPLIPKEELLGKFAQDTIDVGSFCYALLSSNENGFHLTPRKMYHGEFNSFLPEITFDFSDKTVIHYSWNKVLKIFCIIAIAVVLFGQTVFFAQMIANRWWTWDVLLFPAFVIPLILFVAIAFRISVGMVNRKIKKILFPKTIM